MDDPVLTVAPQELLSQFFESVAKDNKFKGPDILSSVTGIVAEPCKDSALQQALTSYVKSSLAAKDTYKPLVGLCNKVLGTIRGSDITTKLDDVLRPEDPSRLIEFVRYDTLPLVYDWLSEPKNGKSATPHSVTLTPDILIVMKNAINDYEASQTSLKGHSFDPSDPPEADTSVPRIGIKDVLGCVDVKQERKFSPKFGSVQCLPGQESESSQVSETSASFLKQKSSSSRLEILNSQKYSRTSSGSRTSSSAPNAHFAQLGNYACEFLSRGPYVTHNIGIKIKNDIMQICWFDRQTTISTEEFKNVEDFDLFVTSIVALSRFSLADWGIATELYPKNGQIEYRLQDGRTLRIDMAVRPICHRITLHGRGTMVLRAELDTNISKESVVVKISYPETRRLQERFFIDKGLQTDSKQHFPKIYHAEDFGSPTSNIRVRLDRTTGCARIRRIMVFEPLDDITSLIESKQVAQVWKDCLKAHRSMWKAGYEHGDISIYNLMYRKKHASGADEITGILNDWDLAICPNNVEDPAAEKGQRTGTLPFAALELVLHHGKSYTRKYRHEVESFGWCLIYICLDDSLPENLKLLRKWHIFAYSYDARIAFLSIMANCKPRPGFEGLYASARVLIRWLIFEVVDLFQFKNTTWQKPDDDEVWEAVLDFLKDDFNKNL